jgi:UDP:flavonoid glycosyltransferase YjiC (YdhE family)
MKHRLTVVAYAVNGSGLGHLTRVLAILRWMRRLAKLAGYTLDAHILTSSEAVGLAFEEGFAAWKIPSKTIVKETEIDKENYLRLARQWVWHSLGLINPDIFLVDTFPGGSFGELLHALDLSGHHVLVKRAMKREFAGQPAVRALLPFYERLIVPDEAGATETFDAEIAGRVRRVGPIMLRSRHELRPRAEARQRLGVPKGKLAVYLSAGGGGDPTAQADLTLLVETLRGEKGLHLVIGAGPLYRGAPLRGANITWLNSFHAMQDFAALDCAISAAGFNSFHELLHTGVPTAFFAQEKIADEQSRRVRVAAEAGCALALPLLSADAALEVVKRFRDKELRDKLTARAREFAPLNAAREAAYETLATALPRAALQDAYEIGAEEFFAETARLGVALEDFANVTRPLRNIEAEERRELALEFFRACPNVAPAMAARLGKDFCGRFAPPADEDAARALLIAAARVTIALAEFNDETGARALLHALGERLNEGAEAEQAGRVWAAWLEQIYREGGSLSWARARLANNNGGPQFETAAPAV